MNVDVSIIIVNYNTARLITNLLKSLQLYSEGFSYEIFIVDNKSEKADIDILESFHSDNIEIISLEENIGFARANNLALQRARGNYILFLNPDTLFIENTIKKVLEFRNRLSTPSIIGVKLLYPDASYQHSMTRFPRIRDYFYQALFLDSIFKKSRMFNAIHYGWMDKDAITEVDSIRGAFMFMDREIAEKLKGFDSDYFLYSEEIDLCYRAKKWGYPVFYFPDTKLVHLESQSMDIDRLNTFIYLYDSKIVFVQKHYGKLYAALFRYILYLQMLNRTLLNGLLFFIKRNKFFNNKFRLFLYTFLWHLGIGRKWIQSKSNIRLNKINCIEKSSQ